MTIDEQLEFLKKGTVDLIREEDLKKKLERSAKTGKPLRVKLGLDPTAPDIHLGHTVVIRKLKAFQDLGHTVIFLIGDFTGMIGDPSGRNVTRPPLLARRDRANAETYETQMFKLLDPGEDRGALQRRMDGQVRRRGFHQARCAKTTVKQILERDDFKSGWPTKSRSRCTNCFIRSCRDTIGRSRSRRRARRHGSEIQSPDGPQPPARIRPGTAGRSSRRRCSKASTASKNVEILGNYIGIDEPANEMFGKVMSISDDLMWR